MKRIALIVLMVLSAAALFANGNPEAAGGAAADAVLSPIELTGTVEMVDDHAVLTADGKTYLLTIPRIAWYAGQIDEDAVVTVRGQLVESDVAHEQVEFDGDGHVMVEEVEIDGEVIAIDRGGRPDIARGSGDGQFSSRRLGDESGNFYARGPAGDDFQRGQGNLDGGRMARGQRI